MLIKSPAEKEDPRITRTRQLILDAFMDGLHEKSFQKLTVRNITENAGINRGTFYSHFPDKYALLDFTIQQAFIQELDKRVLGTSHFSEKNLHELVVLICDFVANSYGRCVQPEQQFESLVEAQVKKQTQELLQKWLEQAGGNFDPIAAATATSWAIYGLVMQWYRDKRKKKVSANQFADQVLPLIMPKIDYA